ncbi:Methyl-accepting chemotaxis protein I [Pandoraea pneumonica]|uniref:Methyl-accepting chemotaxis protein I n=1 Tax=Pandoraea pneumonica TaxID=2508299 RepID=A0A5E4UGY5_9BURK|nr:methyl-accepting chemotaxis protein [Pandoraea pneumonica]VVD99260.1 Methyl-accepting chemotaxis protein I [Pandoraea pneumonica]
MFKNVTIRARLTLALGLFMVLLVVGAAVGLLSLRQSNASLQEVYTNDMASSRALAQTTIATLSARVTLARIEFIADPSEIKTAIDGVRNNLKKADDAWAAYAALPMSDGEKPLADAALASRSKVVNEGILPALKAIESGDIPDFHAKTVMDVPRLFGDYTKAMTTLADLQVKNAADRYEYAQNRYTLVMWMVGIGLLVGLVVGLITQITLTRAIVGPIDDAIKHFEKIAGGDLTQRIEVWNDTETGRLFKGVKHMQDSLVRTVAEVRSGTESITSAAQQIAAGNTDLSARTEQQAASLEETASSMEQLTATVKQNADNARQASQLAVNASDIAARGGDVVGKVVGTMQGISTSSSKIVDIISVIDGIAFQTNILALNAAVEAARAGEQGRGFAVVAGEVRTLAQRSAAAAKEIKELIEDSAHKVQDGSALVEQAGQTMEEIVQAVKRVTDIMGEISAASAEQSGGIEQVNRAVTQMDEVTQQNAALVEEAAAAAGSLEEQANRLKSVVSVFRLEAGQSAAHAAVAHAAPALAAIPVSAATAPRAAARPPVKKAAAPAPKAAPAPAAAPLRRPAPAAAPAARTGTDDANGDWETF